MPLSSTVAAPQADRELVRRMAAGDQAALGELHDRFATLLHSVALRIVGNADDAEEVLEETFWQAWRQAGRYEERRGGISTWLVMIARSRALDHVRGRRRIREERWDELPESDGLAASLDSPDPSPLESAQADELRRVVASAVATLPPEQRETVELAYFRGMSQSEIAQATGQPLGTVKTRARLALQKLREALAVLREDAP
ncbi:MAG TPA: sigma-70 family RNA polymerase sigma factor [Longimicrobium sp.]|nr:sigma-70 family RNA polymerase sigma factor [Longimicrobium sp.]